MFSATIDLHSQNFKIKRIAPAVSAPGSEINVTLKVPTNYKYNYNASIVMTFTSEQDETSFSTLYSNFGVYPLISNDTLLTGLIRVPQTATLGYYNVALEIINCVCSTSNPNFCNPGWPQSCLSLPIVGTDTLYSGLLLDEAFTIKGNVFYDINSNGTKDVSDPAMEYFDVQITSSSSSYTSSTDNNGNYLFYVPYGTYTVSPVLTGSISTTTPNPEVVLVTSSSVSNINFGLNSSGTPSTVSSDFWTEKLKCGHSITGYIGYWVQSGGIIPSVTIKFRPDPLITVLGYNPNFNSTSNDTLIWNFSNLIPYDYQRISVDMQVPDYNYINHSLSFNLIASNGNSQTNANYRDIVKCSWDPNSLTLYSAGLINPDSLPLSISTLDYQIDFQNTGNDTVNVISIVDTLDTNLNFNSFEMIGASGAVNIVKFPQSRVVEFQFNNINLPYAQIDSLNSIGFVKYRISPNQNLASNTLVKAHSSIFFDANPSINTNTSNTIFAENVRISGIESELISNKLHVYPNPTTSEFHIQSDYNDIINVEIYDLLGNKASISPWNSSSNIINLSQLNNGSFIYLVTRQNGSLIRGIVIKN